MEIKKEIIKEEKSPSVKIFNFNESYEQPIYKVEKKGEYKFLSFGADNLYPNLLLDMYNTYGSPLHRAIINKKTKLVAGFGYKDLTDQRLKEWAKKNKLERLLLYIAKDFEIFGSWALEVIWDRGGNTFTLNHLPIHTLRIGIKDKEDEPDYFWYSRNWKLYKKEEYKPEYIKKFDPNDRTGRQVLYFIDYNPSGSDLYGLPSYSTCINFISLDYEIGKFHLNQILQGFSAGFLLSFNTGIPTQDEMNQTYKEIQKNYRGTNGSGSIIITYADSKDQAPTFEPINLNTTDDRFVLLQNTIEKQITQGHECPIALVSSVPGQLGGATEREELMAEFQQYYIQIHQNQIEEALNGMLKTIGFTEEIILNDYTIKNKNGVLTRDEEPLGITDSVVDNNI